MCTLLCRHVGLLPPENAPVQLTTDHLLARWAESAVLPLSTSQKGLLSIMLQRMLKAYDAANDAIWDLNAEAPSLLRVSAEAGACMVLSQGHEYTSTHAQLPVRTGHRGRC